MGINVRVQDPETKKVITVSPQNAMDYEQHLGWKRVGQEEVSDDYVSNPEELLANMEARGRQNAAQASSGEKAVIHPVMTDDDEDDTSEEDGDNSSEDEKDAE